VEGYAPFCKHVFVPNFVKARVPVLLITAANEALLRSGYQARTETVRMVKPSYIYRSWNSSEPCCASHGG